MFYEDGYVFLYGGQGEKGRSLGDFYFLNTKNWVWKRLFLLESPPFRHSQTINGFFFFLVYNYLIKKVEIKKRLFSEGFVYLKIFF